MHTRYWKSYVEKSIYLNKCITFTVTPKISNANFRWVKRKVSPSMTEIQNSFHFITYLICFPPDLALLDWETFSFWIFLKWLIWNGVGCQAIQRRTTAPRALSMLTISCSMHS